MQFVDLKAQYNTYKTEIDLAISEVIENTAFIKGKAISLLEDELAEFTGVKNAIGCSSGTDALLLPLMAWDTKPGDEVLIPDFTFIATAEIPAFYKVKPVFVDIDPITFTMDPKDAEKKITEKTVGIIPVSLYGQIFDNKHLQTIADKYGLWLMEDGAQSFGAIQQGKRSGSFGTVATTSFFPAKPLGCYGDGGAVFTDDDGLAEEMRCILNHGQEKRYYHSKIGLNARLDTIQAAIIRVKLKHFKEEITSRNKVADRYTNNMRGLKNVKTPFVLEGNMSVWAQYTLRIEGDGSSKRRDALRTLLADKNIPTAVHYPVPLHQQKAFQYLSVDEKDCPQTRKACNEVISLPMHPFLTDEEIDLISVEIRSAIKEIDG